MYHCQRFSADEVYYLKDTDLYSNRILSVGFCPMCNKPVAELIEYTFTGAINKIVVSGINAHNLMLELKDAIVHSANDICRQTKSKPFGWKYGINKCGKDGKIKQYACDFYGNKELIKQI